MRGLSLFYRVFTLGFSPVLPPFLTCFTSFSHRFEQSGDVFWPVLTVFYGPGLLARVPEVIHTDVQECPRFEQF